MDEMQRWTAAAAAELGVAPDLLPGVAGPVLDLVREVAHGVSRPAAPLSAFLVGVAAGSAAASVPGSPASGAVAPDVAVDPADALAAVGRLRALAAAWQPAAD
ncbi:DUF6457 domain-containing protein [Cellulomonas pakistanensis]|uniref:DUF6457 domain-containing protein n=1 Tax=Cellulomonas pakistanensis TaxID=992287 RepID=A0A919P5R7_9CELL|nr:DUF6457 domain-containing protein [Cellulomonas pakistanensis]GIG34770.1 hypothetical protein Cpa01nite_01510 [Cellulomonas pakistanensis]